MKHSGLKRLSTCSLSVLIFLLITGMPAKSWAGDFTLKIDGIRSAAGNILVALYDDPAAFAAESKTKTVSSVQLRPTQGTVRFTWHDLTPGAYALAILHDENSDGQMDLKGQLPLEGYAYSRGAGKRKLPSFKDARFDVTSQGQTLTTQMIYFKR